MGDRRTESGQAEARGTASPRGWATLAWIGALLGLFLFAAYSITLIGAHARAPAAANQPVLDFAAYWTAARLAAVGEWRTLFDRPAFLAAQELIEQGGARAYWLYPPPFLLIVLPLGWLGWPAAWLAFNLGSLAVWAVSAWAAGLQVLQRRGLAMLAPAAVATTVVGQNAMLTAALFVAGLYAIERGRTLPAALFFALLTVKPQLGLLIPVALAALGAWRVIGWTAVLALAIHLLATLPFGFGYWPLYLEAVTDRGASAVDAGNFASLSLPPYALMRVLGAQHGPALALQIGVLAAMAALAFWLWRRPLAFPLKAGILLVATPLATPYAFYYEGLLAFAGAAYAARAGFGERWDERLVLLLLWVGALPGIAFGLSFPLHYTPVIALALALLVRRALRR